MPKDKEYGCPHFLTISLRSMAKSWNKIYALGFCSSKDFSEEMTP